MAFDGLGNRCGLPWFGDLPISETISPQRENDRKGDEEVKAVKITVLNGSPKGDMSATLQYH